jgi:plasmid stabilization system protein ParE
VPTRGIEFLEEAGAEYDAAFDWYLERSAEAAQRFSAEVERALGEIAGAPQRWAGGPRNSRRFLLHRFPYLLIYREGEDGVIQILAVAHTSRRPGYWKERA